MERAGSEEKVRTWEIDGLSFSLPEKLVTPTIARMCDKGWYEGEERRALGAHLQPGDRFLELGGGAGLLACSASRILGSEAVTTVEANPDMVPVIEANLRANGFSEARVLHGAAVASETEDSVTLHVPQAFWAASMEAMDDSHPAEVPGLPISALFERYSPSVALIDVEGAEAGFFETPLPSSLRLLVLELHVNRYPGEVIGSIFRRLDRQGFVYEPKGSSGAVVCFTRA